MPFNQSYAKFAYSPKTSKIRFIKIVLDKCGVLWHTLTMKRKIIERSIRIDDTVYDKIKACAKEEKRTLKTIIEICVCQYLQRKIKNEIL